jgi:hypothetical protein
MPRRPPGRTAGSVSSPSAIQTGASKTAAVLARIEVVFYKEILDDHGFPHHCELMRVPSQSVVLDEAVAGAILEFERAQHVSNWTFVADSYEVKG